MFGKIVRIDPRGFGFIRPNGARENIFFHASYLTHALEFDERLLYQFVEFDLVDTPRGPNARLVRPARIEAVE